MKKDNKGFTLVELIVVIVILGILAAILVPALLGYIDKAKNQQDQLNAKTCLTAVKSELAEYYGKGKSSYATKNNAEDTSALADDFKTTVKDLAELATGDKLSVVMNSGSGREKYTVKELYYMKSGSSFYLKFDSATNEWTEEDAGENGKNFPTGGLSIQ